MTIHELELERATLHGHFSRDLAPVLTVDSGDTVRYRTLDAGWHIGPPPSSDAPAPRFEPRDDELDRGHALCGPVAVRGAQPGMVLEVQIAALRPGTWGWTVAGGWDSDLNRRLGVTEGDCSVGWTLDAVAMTGRSAQGQTVALQPFLGVMGMPPDEPGQHSTAPPRACGGNIDCKELVVGSTLYLPIAVPGALFSAGDGHAAQGDGEVSGTAIECPMEQVDLVLSLRDDLRLTTPRAETPAGTLTFGFHEDLDEAITIALNAMLDLLGARYNLSRREALALASVVVDLRITQLVNGVRGVHAVLPHGAVR